jgi:hypothetical protein
MKWYDIMKTGLVLTTINDPILLEGYLDNLEKFGHLDSTQVYVIPDKKTPLEAYDRCERLKKRGLKVSCPDLNEQEGYLKRIGYPSHLIPFNSDNRRNVGYLMALESEVDILISIDDDNFCRKNNDYVGSHSIICLSDAPGSVVNSSTGWFNICSMMNTEPDSTTYARGFPYYARHKSEKLVVHQASGDVHINAGLWLLDPDVDGISWLVNPVHSTSFRGESFILGQKAWSPINTQNTALKREAIAAYYFVKMNYPLAGIPIDRYGDIFSGYFVQACTRHLGGSIRVGSPIADHRRNSHNYMNDAANELACLMVLEDVLPWLTEDARLAGTTYCEAYESLSFILEDAVERFQGRIWTDASRAYFHQMAYCMRKWVQTSKRLLGEG